MPGVNHKTEDRKISRVQRENTDVLNKELGVGKSFDMVCRELHYGGTDFALYLIDGFAQDTVMNQIMEYLAAIKPEQFTVQEIKKLCERYIGFLQVNVIDNLDDVELAVLSGPVVFLVDGEVEAISIDAKEFPSRAPEEPDLERVVRGSRDGFVETLTINTALTRRRVRDPGLRFEQIKVGRRSVLAVCRC
jgi:stage V sporulation protein AF